MNDTPAQKSGRIIEWDKKKGFGFLHDGTHRIFIHHRDFAAHRKVPEPGDTVTFIVGQDVTGRTCAQQALITSTTSRLKKKQWFALLLLLVAPALALHRLSLRFDALLLIITAVVLSAATYVIYWWDKNQARSGGWRTAESKLHLFELIGGWPGAFIAQRRLQHKCSKLSFLVVFWFIVIAHQFVAIDYLLNWRLTQSALQLIQPPA
ncbi:hypothetical protein CMV30_16345 [Nibricoccus aquaticus]|uniref:Uncharacterized protein n=1 Tax=Nibricoccus aquaticus TaxID=2576891 RepID=A0A290QAW6_9BACT|nr:DUF1294 domain-containing protein [Nibricoccus aquaticus]ATC65387.1 hypothetical protein CMV30_16345 [Nibricoccus aquaticus]